MNNERYIAVIPCCHFCLLAVVCAEKRAGAPPKTGRREGQGVTGQGVYGDAFAQPGKGDLLVARCCIAVAGEQEEPNRSKDRSERRSVAWRAPKSFFSW